MNIDELTVKQIREIQSLGLNEKESLYSRYIGKYVIVRSRNEGINAGVVDAADKTGIILKEARRLYYHKPTEGALSWYEGVAESGVNPDSKVSSPQEKLITEDYSITLCTKIAEASIRGIKTHGQS